MELLLKINKKHLKTFTELANTLNVKHFVVSPYKEDEAFLYAMQKGETDILNINEAAQFENWLKK